MPRKKGLPKTGGRMPGSRNKTTVEMKSWVKELIDGNMTQLENDLQALEPKERWSIVERLMQYCIPKQSQVDVKAQVAAEYAELERLLRNAPDDAVTAIVKKIEELKEISKTVKK